MPPDRPELTTFNRALVDFALPPGKTQASKHIRRLHWYVSCRLVIEGGFDPEYILPRPPILVERKGTRSILHHDPEIAKGGERPVFGGLKTKDVDVTVMIPAVGPVLTISLKGISKSFRNLTNRMEEAVGDCTNLHMAYPALVCGFWQLLRANEEDYPDGAGSIKLVDGVYDRDDVSILSGGRPTDKVARYSRALERLSGRNDLRESPSTYEACALTVVQCRGTPAETRVYSAFPRRDAGLDPNEMFKRLYSCYDRRFVYLAAKLEKHTKRETWDPESPLLVDTVQGSREFDEMRPRIG